MHVITWRSPDALAERVRAAAAERGWSINEFLTRVLDAATDPDLAGSEVERMRARLSQAGLLTVPRPAAQRPDPERVDEARRRAGAGTALADIVTRQRG